MGVATDIVRSYRSPRSVLRHRIGLVENEGRALITLILSCGLIFVSQWPQLSRRAFETGEEVQMLLGASLMAWLFIAPLLFYIVAWLLWMVMRLVGGRASGYEMRMATFWSLLVASPLWLLWGLTAGFVGPGPAMQLTGALAFGAFVVFWGLGIFEVSFPSSNAAHEGGENV